MRSIEHALDSVISVQAGIWIPGLAGEAFDEIAARKNVSHRWMFSKFGAARSVCSGMSSLKRRKYRNINDSFLREVALIVWCGVNVRITAC